MQKPSIPSASLSLFIMIAACMASGTLDLGDYKSLDPLVQHATALNFTDMFADGQIGTHDLQGWLACSFSYASRGLSTLEHIQCYSS